MASKSSKYSYLILFFSIFFSLNQGIIHAQNILELKQKLVSPQADSTRCKTLLSLGIAYQGINEDSVVYFLTQSLQIAQNKTHNSNDIARALHQLGFVNLYFAKDESKAFEWFTKSIRVAKKVNDYEVLALCYRSLAVIAIHQHIGNPAELCAKAINYAQKANHWKVLVGCYSVLIGYYTLNKMLKEAEAISSLIMEITFEKDIDIWFTNGLDYGGLLEKQNKFKQAQAWYKKMSLYKDKLKRSKGDFIYLNDIGTLETKLKNYRQAEKHLLNILQIESQKAKVDSFHLKFIFNNLKDLYVAKGDYKKAFDATNNLMQTSIWLDQKRQTEASKIQMIRLKTDLILEKKEVEIALLQTQKRQQLYLLFGVFLVAIILIYSIRIIQKSKKRVELQKVELGKLNTTKDKLFAILSHDFRSPLANLQTFMNLINWGAISQAEFAESVKGFSLQLNNVQSMLDNILNWSISQMGGMIPKVTENNLYSIIEEQLSLYRPVASSKNIEMINDICKDAIVFADTNHLKIIFRNLLQNAIKFTNSQGKIKLSFKEVNNFKIIEINDNGVGLSDEKLKTIFNLDKSTSELGTHREEGTGLGLTLVRELIEVNKGKISVKSTLGVGTTFTIYFETY
jgi:signal transduction histidine kinase